MNKINLSGLPRCNQIWEDMQPIEGGRLCAQCNKCIVDFREKSNYEIAFIHATARESVCGLYTEEQLAFNISKTTVSKKKPSGYTIAFVASLFSLLPKFHAQESTEFLPNKNITVQDSNYSNFITQESKKEPISSVQSDSILLFGKITDINKEPLIGASVLVKGYISGTVTDIDGSFVLNLSKIFEQEDSVTIIYAYTGFISQEKIYHKDTLLDLEENIMLEFGGSLGEPIVISFGIFSSGDNKVIKSLPIDEQKSTYFPLMKGCGVPGVNLAEQIKFNRRSKFPWRKEFWQKGKMKRAQRRASKQNDN